MIGLVVVYCTCTFLSGSIRCLIAKAASESDPEKRNAHFRRAEEILCVEELPILPIYYYVNQGMLRPRVRGLEENIRDLHPFQLIWMDGPPASGK